MSARVISAESKRKSNKRAEFRVGAAQKGIGASDANFHLTIEFIVKKRGEEKGKCGWKVYPPDSLACLSIYRLLVGESERPKCNRALPKFPLKLDYPRSPQRRKKGSDLRSLLPDSEIVTFRVKSDTVVYFV